MREMDWRVRGDVGGFIMNSWMRTAVSSYLGLLVAAARELSTILAVWGC